MKRYIIVWRKPDNTYYHRKVNGFYTNYQIGYENQYNHKIVDIIDFYIEYQKPMSLRKRVLTNTISFLQKLQRRL